MYNHVMLTCRGSLCHHPITTLVHIRRLKTPRHPSVADVAVGLDPSAMLLLESCAKKSIFLVTIDVVSFLTLFFFPAADILMEKRVVVFVVY